MCVVSSDYDRDDDALFPFHIVSVHLAWDVPNVASAEEDDSGNSCVSVDADRVVRLAVRPDTTHAAVWIGDDVAVVWPCASQKQAEEVLADNPAQHGSEYVVTMPGPLPAARRA